jgi:hypothetical protein
VQSRRAGLIHEMQYIVACIECLMSRAFWTTVIPWMDKKIVTATQLGVSLILISHLTSHISHACAHPHRSKQIVHTHIHIHTHTPAHSTHTLATCQTNLTGIHTHKCAHPPSASPPASAASSFLMASLLRLLCLSWTCVRLQLQSVSVMCFICTCVRSQSQSVLVEVCVFLWVSAFTITERVGSKVECRNVCFYE